MKERGERERERGRERERERERKREGGKSINFERLSDKDRENQYQIRVSSFLLII